ncbi:MAG: hypothetical protein ACOYYS_07685 [Chloroflexota bacterium]
MLTVRKVKQKFRRLNTVSWTLLIILVGCTRGHISTTLTEQAENSHHAQTEMTISPELLAFIPWNEDFPGQPVPSSMMGPNGTPKISGYLSPDLLFASDLGDAKHRQRRATHGGRTTRLAAFHVFDLRTTGGWRGLGPIKGQDHLDAGER